MSASKVFPPNDLPPDAKPWARDLETSLDLNLSRAMTLKENSLAEYQQMNTAVNQANQRLKGMTDFVRRLPSTESQTFKVTGVSGLQAGTWLVPISETISVERSRRRLGILVTGMAYINSGTANPPGIFMYLFPGSTDQANQSLLKRSFTTTSGVNTYQSTGQSSTFATWDFDLATGFNVGVQMQLYCSSAVTFTEAEFVLNYTVVYGGSNA